MSDFFHSERRHIEGAIASRAISLTILLVNLCCQSSFCFTLEVRSSSSQYYQQGKELSTASPVHCRERGGQYLHPIFEARGRCLPWVRFKVVRNSSDGAAGLLSAPCCLTYVYIQTSKASARFLNLPVSTTLFFRKIIHTLCVASVTNKQTNLMLIG